MGFIMKRILLSVILIVLILVSLFFLRSCGYIGDSSSPDVPKLDLGLHPSVPLKSTPHDLCPPDGEATEKPIFTAIETEPDGKFNAFGNFSNSKGQIFSLKVTGSRKEAITRYVNELMVCGDVIPLEENITPQKFSLESQVEKLRGDVLALHPDNLTISIDIVGLAQGLNKDEIDQYLKKEPIREELKKPIFINGDSQLIFSASALYRRQSKDFSFDFIIDPTIAAGVSHDYYPVRSSNGQARVTTSIRYDGYGSVGSTLYYGGWWGYQNVQSQWVWWENPEETLEYANNGSADYDLLIQGNQWGGSRYRLYGSLWHNYSPYIELQ